MTNSETTTAGQSAHPTPRGFQVVAATDRSELGDRAVAEALRLCNLYQASMLHVISVADDQIVGIRLPGDSNLQTLPDAQESTRLHVSKLVDEYLNAGGQLGLAKVAVYVCTGVPAERITQFAETVDADVIVLGTHGHSGLRRLLLGSVAGEVVQRAPCAVFVIRPRDFLRGEKLPEVQPPLKPGEHALQPFGHHVALHHIDRDSNATVRIMPAI